MKRIYVSTVGRGAQKRNLTWELTDTQFNNLIHNECHYCGRSPSTTRKARRMNGDLTYNGVDRIDNKSGYTLENVVTCCKICNRAKSDMSYTEFMEWIQCLIKNVLQ